MLDAWCQGLEITDVSASLQVDKLSIKQPLNNKIWPLSDCVESNDRGCLGNNHLVGVQLVARLIGI